MWILKLVRNFALLSMLALAAHAAAGADNHQNGHCGGSCKFPFSHCPTQCVCVSFAQGGANCVPR